MIGDPVGIAAGAAPANCVTPKQAVKSITLKAVYTPFCCYTSSRQRRGDSTTTGMRIDWCRDAENISIFPACSSLIFSIFVEHPFNLNLSNCFCQLHNESKSRTDCPRTISQDYKCCIFAFAHCRQRGNQSYSNTKYSKQTWPLTKIPVLKFPHCYT